MYRIYHLKLTLSQGEFFRMKNFTTFVDLKLTLSRILAHVTNKICRKGMIKMAEKQTAGRDLLGEFAPKFAELNDDVLFGEVWSREKELSPRDRSMITVSALIAGGNFEQLTPHLQKAKTNGITKDEIAEVITHLSFYAGWPKAWSAFNIAKEIYND
jgi:4-carboxymuconolactone decarboxylase